MDQKVYLAMPVSANLPKNTILDADLCKDHCVNGSRSMLSERVCHADFGIHRNVLSPLSPIG